MTDLNVLVCPLAPADICISFDASENRDFLVIGTMSGRAFAYKTTHVFDLLAISQPLPQFNSIHQSLSSIPQPISPSTQFQINKTNQIIPDSNNYELLSPCQSISLIGLLSSKQDYIHSNSPESIYNAAHWNQLPQFTPIRQKFPLRIDCQKQYLFQQDLSYINDLQHYQLQLQQYCHQQQKSQQLEQQHDAAASAESVSIPSLIHSIPTLPTRLTYSQPFEYICRKLVDTQVNCEPIKGVHIVDSTPPGFIGSIFPGSIVMALGDTMLKIAPSIKSPSLLNMKYQRTHDPKLCQSTYCLPHLTMAALVIPGDEDTKPILLDSATQRQTLLNSLPLNDYATPLFLYNSNVYNPSNITQSNQNQLSIAWREYYQQHQTTILLSCSLSTFKITDSLYFSETKRPIGFKQSGQRIVSIVQANYIQINNLMNILITSSLEEYYQIQQRKKDKISAPHLDEEDDHEDGEKPIPSEEEQRGMLIDNAIILGSIISKLDQRQLIKHREHSTLRDQITQFTPSNNTSLEPFFSNEQQMNLLNFFLQNSALFTLRTIISPLLLNVDVWLKKLKSTQIASNNTTNGEQLEDEAELTKELYSHSYLDWLNDQPITKDDSIELDAQIKAMQNISKVTVSSKTSPSIPTRVNSADQTTPQITRHPVRHPSHFSLLSSGKSTDSTKWSSVGYTLPAHESKPSGTHTTVYAELLQHSKTFRCVKFRAHKQGHIVGMATEFDGTFIITLGTDFKLKIWYKGQLICKYVNLKGDLLSTSVVLVKRVGRCIYYTCCDGVYCVVLPFDPIIDLVGTNLSTMMSTLSITAITSEQKLLTKYNNLTQNKKPTAQVEESDVFDADSIASNRHQSISSPLNSSLSQSKILHNDTTMRNFTPRFYSRTLHSCDNYCIHDHDQPL